MGTRALLAPVIESLDALLKHRGYQGKGYTFRKFDNDLYLIVNLQRSINSTSQAVDVTINFGVFVPKLEESEVEVSVWAAHWRQRIGYLTPEARDVWWFIDSEERAKGAAQQIVRYVERYGLPAFREVATLQALEWLWRSGKSPGLTEMQRCRNLERLKALQTP